MARLHRFCKLIRIDEAVVGGGLLILVIASTWAWLGQGYYIEQAIFASRLSGYGALGFLAISILFGPILRASAYLGFPLDWTVSARVTKNTGVASAVAALVHSAISVAGYLQGNWREVLDRSYLYAGLLALVVLVLLLIFSVKPLMSEVGWLLWKPTFRLSFAAALLVFCHLLYAPFASVHWTFGLYAAAAVLFLLRFSPARRAPLSETRKPLNSP